MNLTCSQKGGKIPRASSQECMKNSFTYVRKEDDFKDFTNEMKNAYN